MNRTIISSIESSVGGSRYRAAASHIALPNGSTFAYHGVFHGGSGAER